MRSTRPRLTGSQSELYKIKILYNSGGRKNEFGWICILCDNCDNTPVWKHLTKWIIGFCRTVYDRPAIRMNFQYAYRSSYI